MKQAARRNLQLLRAQRHPSVLPPPSPPPTKALRLEKFVIISKRTGAALDINGASAAILRRRQPRMMSMQAAESAAAPVTPATTGLTAAISALALNGTLLSAALSPKASMNEEDLREVQLAENVLSGAYT